MKEIERVYAYKCNRIRKLLLICCPSKFYDFIFSYGCYYKRYDLFAENILPNVTKTKIFLLIHMTYLTLPSNANQGSDTTGSIRPAASGGGEQEEEKEERQLLVVLRECLSRSRSFRRGTSTRQTRGSESWSHGVGCSRSSPPATTSSQKEHHFGGA